MKDRRVLVPWVRFLAAVELLLVVGKVLHIIDWPWVIVWQPLWIILGYSLVALVVMAGRTIYACWILPKRRAARFCPKCGKEISVNRTCCLFDRDTGECLKNRCVARCSEYEIYSHLMTTLGTVSDNGHYSKIWEEKTEKHFETDVMLEVK